MKITIKEARKVLREMISQEQDLCLLNDTSVQILNMKIRKDRIICDIEITDHDKSKSMRQNKIETSLKDIEAFQKKQVK